MFDKLRTLEVNGNPPKQSGDAASRLMGDSSSERQESTDVDALNRSVLGTPKKVAGEKKDKKTISVKKIESVSP